MQRMPPPDTYLVYRAGQRHPARVYARARNDHADAFRWLHISPQKQMVQ
jgi:hypothetical protein